MKDIQQLIKKNSQEGRYEDIFPKTFTDAVKDKESGKSLIDILSSFNMYFLSYTGSRELTRLQVPMSIRKTGLWITYVLYDKTVVTEWYAGEAIDDDSWKNLSNWRIGTNMLVGDISISSDGYWVVNGVVTTTKAQGEQGITPMLRVGSNNHLQVSYTNGSSWVDVSTNPVYTQFRVHDNKLEQSVDLGATWIVVSDELAYQFRNSGNKLQVSKDLGVTWEDTSDYIASWFRFTGTSGSSQADNVGKIQISRDNGTTWADLSGEFTNSLHIKGYVATVSALPSTAVQGDIYGVGPTYDSSDTEQTNPIYQLYVKDSTGWINNGRFTSISAGVVQELGDSETVVMSQKAVTKITTEYNVSVQHPTSGLDGTNKYTLTGAITLIPVAMRNIGLRCSFLNVDGNIETWEYQGGTYENTSSWMKQARSTYEDSMELVYTILDKDNKVLFGIKKDGSVYTPKGIPEEVNIELSNLENIKVDKEEGKTLINEKVEQSLLYEDSDEFIHTILDKDKKIVFGIRKDGSSYIPKGIPEDIKRVVGTYEDSEQYIYIIEDNEGRIIFGLDKDGKPFFPNRKMIEVKEDIEDRMSLLVDKDGKILSYRKKDGTLVETKMAIENLSLKNVKYSPEFITQLSSDLKNSGFSSGTGDWSDTEKIELPMPRVAGKVNINSDRLPFKKIDDIDASLEYWDKDGNYFKKSIILNAQGNSSMSFDKKNWSVDFVDCKIKFGEWVSQDSFHFKAYYIDSFRGKCNVGYKLTEEMYKSRPVGEQRPWDYLNFKKITELNSNGKIKEDIWTGALAHPDGFPVAIYWNGEFYGVYIWNLKKHRDNYSCNKSEPKHIILDGDLYAYNIWEGTINWDKFEARNPKGLIDINGDKYDGDSPKELSDTDPLSKEVKGYIQDLSQALTKIKASSDKKTEFSKYFNVPFIIDYFIQSQVTYNLDGFGKNWIWCTWDGVLWTPTIYDQDSIFGQDWLGTTVFPKSSTTEILGTSSSLPTGLLWTLYREEIHLRYKELRDKKIISVENIIKILENWVNQVSFDNYDKEFKKWDETPSYRDSNVNSNNWDISGFIVSASNYPDYDENTNYNIGDKCRMGKTNFYGFTCKKSCQGIPPFKSYYRVYPREAGYYESVGRVKLWLENRIIFLDNQFSYNK